MSLESCFLTMTNELTHSVGTCTFFMTPFCSMSFSLSFSFCCRATGIFLGGHITGLIYHG